MTGIEVAQQLQADKSSLPVLTLSAYDDWSYIQALLDAGVAGYLTKAEAPGLIVEAVRGVAQGEQGWIGRQIVKQLLAWLPYTSRQSIHIPLTGREKAVLRLVMADKTNQEIAQTLGPDKKMVETYLEATLAKLGVASREAAAKRAGQQGII
jgi:DNA-binding NarL/FixJ family response regulator